MIVMPDGTEFFVFDGHTHLGGRPYQTSVVSPQHYLEEELLGDMDASGVDMAVVFPRGNPHGNYHAENSYVVEAADRHPDRLVAYARINPYYREECIDHIQEFAERGARGLKFHPFKDTGGTPVNSPDLMHPLMEEAEKAGLVVLIHSGEAWNSSPALIGDLAASFPGVTFIIAHAGLWEFHQEAIVTAKRLSNVYVDTAEVAPPRVVTNCIRNIGQDRVIYGSDRPAIAFGFEIGKVLKYADLTDSEVASVLGENLLGLLNLTPDRAARARVELAAI